LYVCRFLRRKPPRIPFRAVFDVWCFALRAIRAKFGKSVKSSLQFRDGFARRLRGNFAGWVKCCSPFDYGDVTVYIVRSFIEILIKRRRRAATVESRTARPHLLATPKLQFAVLSSPKLFEN
jgi:hypothetical protein